jgi:hypothetical protein
MKRTCLQINTTCPDLMGIEDQRKLNTDEQNTCEFHPDDMSFNDRLFDPKEIQHVKCFVQMKRITYSFIYFVALVIMLAGCQSSKKSAYKKSSEVTGKLTSSEIILKAPVNSADEAELKKKVYYDETYSLLQRKEDKFKENAPYIEFLDGGKRERMWFSSSRADDKYYNLKPTNNYQQIYYAEREVGEGKSPNEGWENVTLFEINTDNPYLANFISAFNKSTKGALTFWGNTLIFSCDLLTDGGYSEFKNLWEVKIRDGKFDNPKPIAELSNDNTWESQPTISPNGKHLFFVSNRFVGSDGKIDNKRSVNTLNIFYSFRKNDKWSDPVVVSELNSKFNDVSPHIQFDGEKIYFSSNRSGDYQIYEAPLALDDENGKYIIDKSNIELFSSKAFNVWSPDQHEIQVNDVYDQQYPFIYFNPYNKKSPRAIFWASNAPDGYGSYDIYATDIPFEVELTAHLIDVYPSKKITTIQNPVIELKGYNGKTVQLDKAAFTLYAGLRYSLFGGSNADKETGAFFCDEDPNYIFIGYSSVKQDSPFKKELHAVPMTGQEAPSEITKTKGFIQVPFVTGDSAIVDTILITRAWEKKPKCPGKLNIEPTHRSIAYFQTGYWEVNTTENFKRDMTRLHEGFDVSPGNDMYNPTGKIIRKRSDYRVIGLDAPLYPVDVNDKYAYSIANAHWVELHPNNFYWGDRLGYESRLALRMEGRKARIKQYADYAQKVDENLKNLTDTIKNKYIHLLDQHKELKPKLLIEIFAVSDRREVSRSWYIGETVEYRGSEYNESTHSFDTEPVKIVSPDIDESTKTITRLKACTIELNNEGDNGSILGIPGERTDLNTNLSRLRAWYGYKEVLKRLSDSDVFNKFNKQGKVALPDNNVSYNDADIIIITRGKREDGDVDRPQKPYPSANNPTGNGYFDYDKIRRIEIQTRLLIGKEQTILENYCCDPKE